MRFFLLILCLFSIPLCAAESLLVSNYPEEILEPGLIAYETCTKSVRILYYHKSLSSKPLELGIMVKNEGKKTATFEIIKVMAGPDPDGLYAGHRVTYQYFDKLRKKQVEKLTLAPGRSVRILSQGLKLMQVSVAMVLITPTTPSVFSIKLWAVDPHNMTSVLNMPLALKAYNYGFFQDSEIYEEVMWKQEELIHDLVIGDAPYFNDTQHKIELKGNYGVMYAYKVALVNMGNKPQKISLYVSPAGGVARGILEVDDKLIETAFFQKKNEYEPEKVYEWDLKPGHVRFATIRTMPQAGSFYPVHFVLRRDVAK